MLAVSKILKLCMHSLIYAEFNRYHRSRNDNSVRLELLYGIYLSKNKKHTINAWIGMELHIT